MSGTKSGAGVWQRDNRATLGRASSAREYRGLAAARFGFNASRCATAGLTSRLAAGIPAGATTGVAAGSTAGVGTGAPVATASSAVSGIRGYFYFPGHEDKGDGASRGRGDCY